MARGLGDRAAERLDVETVVSGVLRRLRAGGGGVEERRSGLLRGRGRTLLRIAAALAVLAGGGLVARGALERGAVATTSAVPAPVLTAALSEPKDTIEEVYEPYLIQEGFLQKTPRGRVATPKAFGHLGLPVDADLAAQLALPVK